MEEKISEPKLIDIDHLMFLRCIENNETMFNSEIYLDHVINIELDRMLNILYLDCKNEHDYFNKQLFEKVSEKLKEKISTRYDGLVDIYKKL